MNNSNFISANRIKSQYDVSNSVLRSWADSGKIECLRLPGGKRLYKTTDIDQLLGQTTEEKKYCICYARVSSDHQKEDLKRQIQDLQTKFPNNEIISDIGSGLNWKRKGFTSLLENATYLPSGEMLTPFSSLISSRSMLSNGTWFALPNRWDSHRRWVKSDGIELLSTCR